MLHVLLLHLQINMGSIAPITASQFGTNRLMEKLLLQRSGQQELGTMGRFSCAAVAGTVSALVATPTELIIIQQQVCVCGETVPTQPLGSLPCALCQPLTPATPHPSLWGSRGHTAALLKLWCSGLVPPCRLPAVARRLNELVQHTHTPGT